MGATFRANVGAVIADDTGRVLILRRADGTAGWQFPQGGIKRGEEPDDAIRREIAEETGIDPASLTMVAEHPSWLAYELPEQHRSQKTGRGQVQKWYLFRLADDAVVELPKGHDAEFSGCEWVDIDHALTRIVEFKRPVYEQVVRLFRPLLTTEAVILSDGGRAYALAEFEHVTGSFVSNEEMGERRVVNYVTFVALLATAVGLVADALPQAGDVETLWLAFAASLAGLCMGFLTFRRILKRNVTTTQLLGSAHRLRLVLTADDDLARLAMPFGLPERRRFRWLKGGLAEAVAVLNSLLAAAALTLVATHFGVPGNVTATAAGAAFLLAAWLHHISATRYYRRSHVGAPKKRPG